MSNETMPSWAKRIQGQMTYMQAEIDDLQKKKKEPETSTTTLQEGKTGPKTGSQDEKAEKWETATSRELDEVMNEIDPESQKSEPEKPKDPTPEDELLDD